MGAGNVALVFQLYAGKVPATSFQVLTYMALVSKDADARPWFSKGREALALFALGRTGPFGRADAKAVERALGPLFDVGAIETDRRSSVRRDGDSTARYRLNLNPLDGPQGKPHAPRKAGAVKAAEDPQRPPESGPHAPRKTGPRPPETVPTPPEKRGPEENEDFSRSEIEEEMADLQTACTSSRAREPSEPPSNVIPIERPPPRLGRLAAENLAGAAARRARAVAEHQARLAAGETT